MGRWEPNALGRLQEAALYLYAERGYDETTVAEIAERAGLTKRTFFRYFADKREVLFYGSEFFQQRFVAGAAQAPEGASALEAISAALAAVAQMLEHDRGREFASLRQRVINATPELQERELSKLATVAAATADVLIARGIEPLRARLAAEAGIAVVKVAFARWVQDDNTLTLAQLMQDSLRELALTTGGG